MHDTKVMSSYVDENFSNGLKQNSKRYLNYDQVSYAEVTTLKGLAEDLPKGGRLISSEDTEDGMILTKQYRMNELTASQVILYGCDDTICTTALYNVYQTIMEIEGTFGVYKEVEIKPAYLTALAYTQGLKVSIERLKELEKEDDATYEAARIIFEKALLEHGILDKMWEPIENLNTTAIKDACKDLFGFRPETKVRTPSKLAEMIRIEAGDYSNPMFSEFCAAVERTDLNFINGLMLKHYKSRPAIDMDSPKQMQKFLYDVLGLPVRVVSKLTAVEREKNKPLAKAMYKYSKFMMKGELAEMTDDEWKLLRLKARTDDTSVMFALLYEDAVGVTKEILNAMTTMKTISTRRKFYYRPYPAMKHWKDGKIHSSINQCATVTRRYSCSGPNLQQLPKKSEGVKIRGMIVPHHKNAVIVSLDFSGQELRLTADQSRDVNMLACYIGDRLKDIHSITAAGAMEKKWGKAKLDEMVKLIEAETPTCADDLYDIFTKLRKHKDYAIAKMADDLRKVAKNVNFGATYDAQALTLSETIGIPVKDTQNFLDAKYAMFPRVETWKDEVRADVERTGYATTMMGARRHLGKLLQDRATANKAGRQGPNFKIQGSAAEMTKLAMARVWDSGVLYDFDCVFYAPVHDELVFSIDRNDAAEAIRIIHACMTDQYADMIVPALSSISLGSDFAKQIECGDYYDAVAINDALYEVFGGDWRKPLQEAA